MTEDPDNFSRRIGAPSESAREARLPRVGILPDRYFDDPILDDEDDDEPFSTVQRDSPRPWSALWDEEIELCQVMKVDQQAVSRSLSRPNQEDSHATANF